MNKENLVKGTLRKKKKLELIIPLTKGIKKKKNLGVLIKLFGSYIGWTLYICLVDIYRCGGFYIYDGVYILWIIYIYRVVLYIYEKEWI